MAGALSMLTACSSDGENEPGGNHPVAPGDGLQTKTYTDADGNIEENPDAVSFYLGTETLLPILKVVSPVFADQDMIDLIVGIASQDPNMGAMAGMLPGILQALPDVIGTTSRIELGINLNKVS